MNFERRKARAMSSHTTVEYYADKWRNLRAWGALLPMAIELVAHKGTVNLGLAWSRACKAKVRITGDLPRDLATLLHEMAHLAAPNSEHHGARWKEVYIRAAAEALDCSPDDFEPDVPYLDLDQQVIDYATAYLEAL